jgi:predicted RNA-binding Zn-ribbon protein involved in translation (DUF1610 family)
MNTMSDEPNDELAGLFVRRTREDWLLDAYDQLRQWFKDHAGLVLPERIRLSVGFGYGARAESKIILGQCWATWKADDRINQVFISPEVSDPVEVLKILVHEMVHVCDDNAHKHGKEFREIAHEVGLIGKMTEVHVDDGLLDHLTFLAFELGQYPHGALEVTRVRETVGPDGGSLIDRGSSGPKKQGTRMIKFECPACGWTGRATKQWLDQSVPKCGTDGTQMIITDLHWEG